MKVGLLARKDKGNSNLDIVHLSADDFMFHVTPIIDRILSNISSRYIPGTIEHLKEHHPTLYRKLMDLPKKLEVYQGEKDIEKYKAVLGRWHSLWLKAIETYKAVLRQNGTEV